MESLLENLCFRGLAKEALFLLECISLFSEGLERLQLLEKREKLLVFSHPKMLTTVQCSYIFSTFIQISLLIHFSRLNFHPMHLAHFLSSSLAFGLFADPDQQCYRLSSSSALIHDFKMPVFWESSHDNDASSIFPTRSVNKQSASIKIDQYHFLEKQKSGIEFLVVFTVQLSKPKNALCLQANTFISKMQNQ